MLQGLLVVVRSGLAGVKDQIQGRVYVGIGELRVSTCLLMCACTCVYVCVRMCVFVCELVCEREGEEIWTCLMRIYS